MMDLAIERLIPHRGRMKLIDEIIQVDDTMAVSRSTITDQWPLWEGDGVQSLVIIELIAQTSAITIGWKELKPDDPPSGGTGWLVGIKTACFQLEKIPVNARILTEATIQFTMDNYTELIGRSTMDGELVGEAVLQVMRADRTADE